MGSHGDPRDAREWGNETGRTNPGHNEFGRDTDSRDNGREKHGSPQQRPVQKAGFFFSNHDSEGVLADPSVDFPIA